MQLRHLVFLAIGGACTYGTTLLAYDPARASALCGWLAQNPPIAYVACAVIGIAAFSLVLRQGIYPPSRSMPGGRARINRETVMGWLMCVLVILVSAPWIAKSDLRLRSDEPRWLMAVLASVALVLVILVAWLLAVATGWLFALIGRRSTQDRPYTPCVLCGMTGRQQVYRGKYTPPQRRDCVACGGQGWVTRAGTNSGCSATAIEVGGWVAGFLIVGAALALGIFGLVRLGLPPILPLILVPGAIVLAGLLLMSVARR